jgi:hypothetical protein
VLVVGGLGLGGGSSWPGDLEAGSHPLVRSGTTSHHKRHGTVPLSKGSPLLGGTQEVAVGNLPPC